MAKHCAADVPPSVDRLAPPPTDAAALRKELRIHGYGPGSSNYDIARTGNAWMLAQAAYQLGRSAERADIRALAIDTAARFPNRTLRSFADLLNEAH